MDAGVLCPVALVDVLRSGNPEQVCRQLENLPTCKLRPQMETMQALASLLLADDPDLKRAAAAFLTSAASQSDLRSKVS